MSSQDITRFSMELVASTLDLLEGAGTNPKLCASVRQLIYSKRDSFILKNLTGTEREYDKVIK